MAYLFHEVDIIGFDTHTALKPVAFPQLVKEPFRFLVSTKEYNEQYKSAQEVETDYIILRPITQREFKRNHFWKHYAAMSFGPEVDYWGVQIPFAVEPKSFDLKINPVGLSFEVEVRPVVYINSMGWSTNVELHLKGDIDAAGLRDFVGRLRGLDHSQAPFLVAGEEKGLTGVFQRLGDLVRNEVYVTPAQVGDTRSTPRHLLISLARAEGEAKYFRTEWGLQPTMDDDERRDMISILYGREISNDEADRLLRQGKGVSGEELEEEGGTPERVLVVRVRKDKDKDFTLTSYKLGTLFFPQGDALERPKRRKAMGCMVSNARNATMISLSMLGFSQAVKKFPKSNDAVESLHENIKATIWNLSDHYDNDHYQNWYSNHRLLQSLRAEPVATEEASKPDVTSLKPRLP